MMSSLQWLRLKVRIQRLAGYVAHLPFGNPVIFGIMRGFRYRVQNLEELRAMYQSLVRTRRPLLICSNHLSFMDPILLHHTFSSHLRYFVNYRSFAWNLAASEYSRNPIFGPVCWISKVLFIHRGSRPKYLEDLFQVVSELLAQGDVVNIFPEGRRSRTGRFDDRKLAYGIGQILCRLPQDFSVLCVYLRGDGEAGFGAFPKRGTTFSVRVRRIDFQRLPESRDAATNVTQEIARQIQNLEDEYFRSR
jgi:1-acyl-sn-glycerol-3-phosphate acyltransferase